MAIYPISGLLPEQHDNINPAPIHKPLPTTPPPFIVRAPTPAVPASVPVPVPQRTPSRTAQTASDRTAPRAIAERPGASNNGAGMAMSGLAYQYEWSSGGQSGNGEDGHGQDELSAADLGNGMDTEALLELLPISGDSGIFEVLLPDGERIGVVTDVRDSLASFLLTTSSDKLRSQLQRKRLELERGLVRRMRRQVRLAVL